MLVRQPGVSSQKFLDINKIQHVFPEEINCVGFAVTLLHNHPHAPSNYVLCYKKGFTEAVYLPRKETNQLVPCSWFLENGQVLAYEYCEDPISFDMT